MTTPPKAGTTEHASERRFAQVPVRLRITAFIALLTLAAMTVSGVLVYALESASIEAGVKRQIDQEIEEFRVFERRGIDPRTGTTFTDALRLVQTFLVRNVPDETEMLVAYEGEAPRKMTPSRNADFIDDPDYHEAVRGLLADGGTAEVSDARFGEVWVTVVPVQSQTSQSALVIVNFLDGEHAELESTLQTYAIVAALSLVLITLLAARQSGRLLAPLRTVREAASDITTSDLSRRIPERGNDDITALTRTFNDMLDRLEDGVEAQRRFLDDAGHELRTPLTVLGGHLELMDPNSPDEVARTRALLLDEVYRMARLVGDLILLAKSRRPDFVHARPVDLSALTESLLDKARALGERDWVLERTGHGLVTLDEQRVTQAVLQLADNAVKHTQAGDRIALGSSHDGHTVRLWVHDAGHGVRPEDRARIFERFGRGHVRPGDEGFGLGLSIVRAIAEAHGGTVHLADGHLTDAHATDGIASGARFELVLPTDSSGSV